MEARAKSAMASASSTKAATTPTTEAKIRSRRPQSSPVIQQVAHNEPCPDTVDGGADDDPMSEAGSGARAGGYHYPTLPPTAFTGSPHDGLGPDGRPLGSHRAPWAPPGIARPWPPEEYIGDGGDGRTMAIVGNDWRIDGLDPEDTLAHYETVDGRTLITPSNHVKLYAPRFAAVRRVNLVNSIDQQQNPLSARIKREALIGQQDMPPKTVLQPVAARGEIGEKLLTVQQQNQPPLLVESQRKVAELVNRFKAYEDFRVVRVGVFSEAEKALLAMRVEAANVWTRDQAAQVTINGRKAIEAVADRKAQTTYMVDDEKHPRLRLVKVASADMARPGDIVEFTLRYDNLGDEVVGNVTIVDSLTTRLEYVEGSAQSSKKATFSVKENDAGSLELRWEITEPLPAGKGGILRFNCRVR